MLVQNNLALVASTNERKISLYDLFDRYLKSVSKASANNIKYLIIDFKKLIEDKDLVDVTVDDIQLYIDYKKTTCSKDATIYRYYRILVTIFNYAVSHEYISKNPCVGVKIKHIYRSEIRNIDYSKKYIRNLKKLFKNTQLYYLVLLALHTRNEKS